ncbi:MAG: hypothetical protein AB7U98_01215 [Candidatus Nitrosocosmicus sp.]
MNDRTWILNSVGNVQIPKVLYKRLRNEGYKTLGFKNLSQVNSDGMESLTAFFPSLSFKIIKHNIKPEADLIYV